VPIRITCIEYTATFIFDIANALFNKKELLDVEIVIDMNLSDSQRKSNSKLASTVILQKPHDPVQ